MDVWADEPVRDAGTIVVWNGRVDGSDDRVLFGVDHRIAQGLFDLTMSEEGPALVTVADYQVIRRWTP